MANKKSADAVVNLDDSDLQFSTTHTFSNQPDSALDQDEITDDRTGLLSGEDTPSRSSTKYNFLSIEFYQQFFDVDTEDVKGRVLAAMIPSTQKSFLQDVVQKKPDLYGPIWICATLVICVAVAGNLASYFQTSLAGDDFQWHYDFHKVTLAATAVFSYAWLVPSGIYAFLWWTSNAGLASLSFLELICLYGYSLVIYIPVSILWLIQYSLLQWLLVLVGAGLSGAVLILTLWPIFKENANRTSFILIGVIIALHLLLACGFMLYFFHVPGNSGSGAAPVNDSVKESIDKIQADDSKAGVEVAEEKDKEEEKAKKEEGKEKRTAGDEEEKGDEDGNEKDVGPPAALVAKPEDKEEKEEEKEGEETKKEDDSDPKEKEVEVPEEKPAEEKAKAEEKREAVIDSEEKEEEEETEEEDEEEEEPKRKEEEEEDEEAEKTNDVDDEEEDTEEEKEEKEDEDEDKEEEEKSKKEDSEEEHKQVKKEEEEDNTSTTSEDSEAESEEESEIASKERADQVHEQKEEVELENHGE